MSRRWTCPISIHHESAGTAAREAAPLPSGPAGSSQRL